MSGARKAGRKAGRPGVFKPGDDPRRNLTIPGPGAPPSAIRAAMRDAYAARLPKLVQLADSKNAKTALAAMLQLGRFGLGPARAVNEDDLRDRLRDTLAVIRATVPQELLPGLEARLAEIWLGRPVGRLAAGDAA
jgi:hypothetical protein